jgi:DNA-binding Lrp family transcriptional regulator
MNSIDLNVIDVLLNAPGSPLGVLASTLEKRVGCGKEDVTRAVRKLVRQGVLSEYGATYFVRPLLVED